MEARKVLAVVTDKTTKRTVRVWRITKGVLRSETGKLRVHLYLRGKTVPHVLSLCHDRPMADEVARKWMREGVVARWDANDEPDLTWSYRKV